MDETLQSFVDELPRGAVLLNPKAGDYPQAYVESVEVVEGEDGTPVISDGGNYKAKVRFPGLTDQEGNTFDHTETVNVPSVSASVGSQRMFLRTLHDFGVVAQSDKRAVIARSPEEYRQVVAGLNKALTGKTLHIKLKEDGNGFLRLNVQRPKFVKKAA